MTTSHSIRNNTRTAQRKARERQRAPMHVGENRRRPSFTLPQPSATVAALVVAAFGLLSSVFLASAATLTNNASIKVDSGPNLTFASGPFTVSCWLRLSIPSTVTLTTNMVVLLDRADGDTDQPFAYLFRFNAFSGDTEFLMRGDNGLYTKTLIQRPYLERWYHLAVVRSGASLTAYVDGRLVQNTPENGTPSSTGTAGSGVAIGGIGGNSQLFFGDIIEVAAYGSALPSSLIQDRMFKDQRPFDNLKGYYKLGYSTNADDFFRNFVPSPLVGTERAVKLGTGEIAFEETDQAGEQSAFDSRKNHGDQAITPLSGAFTWEQVALARPVPGIAFDFRFGYSSGTPGLPPSDGSADPYDRRVLSVGWRHTFDTRIIPDQNFTERRLLTWDGAIETWVRTNNVFKTRHREYRGELALIPETGQFEWTTPERLVYRFRDPTDGTVMAGRLLEIRDFNANRVQLLWDENEAIVTNVLDTAGAGYTFRYNAAVGVLTNVSFGAWQVNFGYDATNRLVSKSITNTSGLYTNVNTTWQFAYNASNGLLERITDPRGNTGAAVTYDTYGRKVAVADALGRTTTTEYGVPEKRQMRHTDPDGFKWVETYDRKGRILGQRDPLGNETRYTYDDRGNRTSITEPLGWTTTFGYDDRANVVASTNALGEVSRWRFHPFFNKAVADVNPLVWTNRYLLEDATGNLLRHEDDIGTLVAYTYGTNGLPLTSTDANGNLTRFAYDTNGFLIATTDPLTNTTWRAVNDVGWALATTNALGEVTTLAYDLNGNPVQTVDPLRRSYLRTYDPNGNLLSESDGLRGPAKRFTTYAYDAANQRTQRVDRAGNAWQLTYTQRGNLKAATDPIGNTVTTTYDDANRVLTVTDPAGNSVSNRYDANGNLVAFLDKLGQKWSKTYDRLNRVVADSDPLGNTRRIAYDAAGRIAQTSSPNGFASVNTYDGRGRLTKWVDPESYEWRYDYDGNANITNITDALEGRYVMAYSPRNERTLEQNQNGFRWLYEYDPLGRLARQTDPNGTTRTPTYDHAGRIVQVDFKTGRLNSFIYDENNNLTLLSRAGSGLATSSQLRYDAVDRVIEHTDPFGHRIGYSYDPLGRVIALTYPDGKVLTNRYDALSRLTNQVDWAGRQMLYAYDKADRLIARTYPNGVSQTNTFDNAGRITGLAYSPSTISSNTINIALAYAYDRNGNKTNTTERGTLTWLMPALKDEQARYTPSGRLIDRRITPLDAVNPEPSTLDYSYDASGNMINAVGNGQSWSLTYDEDNRTTTIAWDTGLTAKHIVNRYDAFGRRVARAIDGNEIRFVLDLAGSMERVLCDVKPFGEITAWYVHGPDLCYRVDATETVTCYHSDAQANIIALTGTDGTSVAQYAYTPYGRSLGSTNLHSHISNPHLFVGSQGVMEDLAGLYFMRARYYSAEAGVFLSTDPVKRIGPGWQPVAYAYAEGNPLSQIDPKGEFVNFIAGAVGGALLGGGLEFGSQFVGNLVSGEDVFDIQNYNTAKIAGAAVGGAITGAIASTGVGAALLANPAGAAAISALTSGASTVTENAMTGNPLEAGVQESMVYGAATGFLASKINIGNKGQLYTGTTRGAWGKSLASRVDFINYSHPRNWLLQTSFQLAGKAIETRNADTTSQTRAPSSSLATPGGSFSSGAASAANMATTLNAVQVTTPAVSCVCTATTTSQVKSGGGSTGGGGTVFSNVVSTVQNAVQNASNTINHVVQQVASTVSTAVNNAVNTVSSWVGSLFGGKEGTP